MSDAQQPRRRPGRFPILRSLWSLSRAEAKDDTEAGRSIVLPAQGMTPPLQQVLRRLLMALAVLALTTLLVWLERDGYRDNAHDELTFLGAAYYATVTLSTTGYGDITPVSDGARLTNILLITPLRVLFLIILVGTTLEVLTARTRHQVRIHRWRSRMRDHTVVIGYGTKGRHTIETLIVQGVPKDQIVVVDPQQNAVDAASSDGFVAVHGDATRSDTLTRAELQRAARVVVATQRDDTAALVDPDGTPAQPGTPRSWWRSGRTRTCRCSSRAAPTSSSPVPARRAGCWGCRWPARTWAPSWRTC